MPESFTILTSTQEHHQRRKFSILRDAQATDKLKSDGNPMNTNHMVEICDDKRLHLEKPTSFGKVLAHQIKRDKILLNSGIRANWFCDQDPEQQLRSNGGG